MAHFWPTYLPISDYIRFSQIYLPTKTSDILSGRPHSCTRARQGEINKDLTFLLNTYTIILYSLECFNFFCQFEINFVLKLVPHTMKRFFLILSWTDFIWFERLYLVQILHYKVNTGMAFSFCELLKCAVTTFVLWEMIYLVWLRL